MYLSAGQILGISLNVYRQDILCPRENLCGQLKFSQIIEAPWTNSFVSRRPFWMTEYRFQSHFSPFQINAQLCFGNLFSQNGRRRAFCITENHVISHFSPFQIDTQLKFFGKCFDSKMATGGHFGWPKFTYNRISRHFRSIRNFFLKFVHAT